MEVEIIDYTTDAIEKLILTKSTRLQGQYGIEDIKNWSYDRKMDELNYMLGTIKSSFEFVHFTFSITGVSRNFTHQLVRTRNASYAQESLRAVDASNKQFYMPPNATPLLDIMYHEAANNYQELLLNGYAIQDAREILPTGVLTSIIAKIDLRELSHMAETRLCYRTAGEYQEVFKKMKAEVIKLYPEFERMIRVHCAKHGTCCFPNYKECPIQESTVKISQLQKDTIQEIWSLESHVADPGIYNG
jgi:flavin-dependent thymidylate synthase